MIRSKAHRCYWNWKQWRADGSIVRAEDRLQCGPANTPPGKVVGAGPAGLSAATASAQKGCSVALLDEKFQPGGQIWLASVSGSHRSCSGTAAIGALQASGATVFAGRQVVDARPVGELKAWVDASRHWKRTHSSESLSPRVLEGDFFRFSDFFRFLDGRCPARWHDVHNERRYRSSSPHRCR